MNRNQMFCLILIVGLFHVFYGLWMCNEAAIWEGVGMLYSVQYFGLAMVLGVLKQEGEK